MKFRVQLQHMGNGSRMGHVEPCEFAILPRVGELVHLGGDKPVLVVVSILHAPMDDEFQVVLFVEVSKPVEQAERIMGLLRQQPGRTDDPGSQG